MQNRISQKCVLSCIVVLAALLSGTGLFAQTSLFSNWQGSQESGPTANLLVQGGSDHYAETTTFNTNIGYNLNQYFGVDAGVPFYFVREPSFFSDARDVNRQWFDGIGDPYLDLRLNATRRSLDLLSVVIGTAPTSSYSKGYSTGRVGINWYNYVDGSVHGFTPFADFGMGNGILDQSIAPRPYLEDLPFQTLGFVSNFEGGLAYKVWRKFDVGASMYAIVPGGQQKVFSELVAQNNLNELTGLSTLDNHGRVWTDNFETTGPARLDRDNGYSGFLSCSLLRNVDFQVGYVHSVRYDLDRVTFTVAFNANSLARKLTNF